MKPYGSIRALMLNVSFASHGLSHIATGSYTKPSRPSGPKLNHPNVPPPITLTNIPRTTPENVSVTPRNGRWGKLWELSRGFPAKNEWRSDATTMPARTSGYLSRPAEGRSQK